MCPPNAKHLHRQTSSPLETSTDPWAGEAKGKITQGRVGKEARNTLVVVIPTQSSFCSRHAYRSSTLALASYSKSLPTSAATLLAHIVTPLRMLGGLARPASNHQAVGCLRLWQSSVWTPFTSQHLFPSLNLFLGVALTPSLKGFCAWGEAPGLPILLIAATDSGKRYIMTPKERGLEVHSITPIHTSPSYLFTRLGGASTSFRFQRHTPPHSPTYLDYSPIPTPHLNPSLLPFIPPT